MMKISGEMIVSVMVAIASSGAGAPLTVGNLGKPQKAITDGVKPGDRFKLLFKKLCQVAVTIVPKINATTKRQDACNDIMNKIDKGELGASLRTLPKHSLGKR